MARFNVAVRDRAGQPGQNAVQNLSRLKYSQQAIFIHCGTSGTFFEFFILSRCPNRNGDTGTKCRDGTHSLRSVPSVPVSRARVKELGKIDFPIGA